MAPRVAYFISSHGFGHATRSCAVIEAVWRRAPETSFELFTTVPPWLFEDSLAGCGNRGRLGRHDVVTDVGLVQTNALEENLAATVRALDAWIPFRRRRLRTLGDRLRELRCSLVVCDVSPLGLAAARAAGLPSLLVENFTWDWIYGRYAAAEAGLRPAAGYLAEVYAGASRRVQAEPWCQPVAGALKVAPISRPPRHGRRRTRARLEVPPGAALVLVTMGGIEWDYGELEEHLTAPAGERWLVIPGGARELRRHGRVVRLPHRSQLYHPDLIHAADAVVGKLGYSTLAEVYRAGLAFGYVPRAEFPESPALEAWVRAHLPHRRIAAESFTSGRWLDDVDALLALPRRGGPAPAGRTPDGAAGVAEAILEMAR